MGTTSRNLGLLLGTGAFLLAGCGAQVEPPPAEPAAQAPAAPQTAPVSINAEMVALVDHAGHALWDAEVEKTAPKSDADWSDIEHHAIQLAASGTLLLAGGTGVNDLQWIASPDWQKWSRALSDAGLAARKAAEARNLEALVNANGQLVEACEGCHKEFKPDLPSEGLTHAHTH